MTIMWLYVRSALVGATLWGAGDFLAQAYDTHKRNSKQRIQKKKETGGHHIRLKIDDAPSKRYLAQSTVFGLVAGSAAHHYQRLLIRACGTLHQRSMFCFFALGLQQMVWTPLLLLSYFNSMTAARGGFSNPGFMPALAAGTQGRQSVWSIEKHIVENVMPTLLLSSWLVFSPLFLFAYIGLQRGVTVLGAVIALPWCSAVAFAQHQELF